VTYFHFTCDHGHDGIGGTGTLLPGHFLTKREVPWTGRLVWLTDLAAPDRDALGLTSRILSCDRTRHRYRVTDETEVLPWVQVARTVPHDIREQIEGEPGSRPMHWYVSPVGVPAVYDPVQASFPVERARL